MWILRSGDENAERGLVAAGVPPLAAKVLSARKIRTPELAAMVLNSSPENLPNPFLLPDMPAAVGRVKFALERGEKIAVHGDYDVDGITATAMVVGWLRGRGADCISLIPAREGGYGVTVGSVERLHEAGVKLIITVDSGTAACEAAARAKELGVDMIITDHHECTGSLPEAAAVINPMRADSSGVARELAGVGVAFMLIAAVEGCGSRSRLLDEWSDLVAIGTIADVAPIVAANRALCAAGVECVRRAGRIGLAALMNECKLAPESMSSGKIGIKLAPRLNAAERMGSACDAVELLLTDDPKRAAELSCRLCELNRQRQNTENEMLDAISVLAENERMRFGEQNMFGAIVLAGENWKQEIAGIVASRLSERYARPVFLICIDPADGSGKGSARSFYGVSILDMLRRTAYLLDSWGGHEFAAGFTIKAENIPLFREMIRELSVELPMPHIHVDAKLEPGDITPELVDGLRLLEPFGQGNENPLFILHDVEIDSYVKLGYGSSARLTVRGGNREFRALCFGSDPTSLDLCDGDRGDMLCRLSVSEKRGERRVTVLVKGMMMPPDELRRFRSELALFDSFRSGEELTPDQANVLAPKRGDFVGVLRHLRRNSSERNTLVTNIGSMCRRICRDEKLPQGYARIMVCLEALSDVGALSYADDGEIVSIQNICSGQVDLRNSCVMKRLRRMICGKRDGAPEQTQSEQTAEQQKPDGI